MASYAAKKTDYKRKAAGLGFALLLQGMFVYGLMTGLGHKLIDVVKGPMVTKIITPPKPQTQVLPPPPPPQIVTPPPPYIPPPVVQIETPPVSNAITAVNRTPPPAPQAVRPAPPAAPVAAVPDTDVSEVPIGGATPQYPAAMEDDEREGYASVECLVGVNGHTSDCRLLETRGGNAFGISAMNFASSQIYRPAMHNGVPYAKRKRWNLTFSLN